LRRSLATKAQEVVTRVGEVLRRVIATRNRIIRSDDVGVRDVPLY
jgi:hypothetical protein